MTGQLRWSGTPAWVLARTYHLAMMPGVGRRARLLVDWNIGLLFGRDTAELGGVAAVKPGAVPPLAADRGNGAASPDGTPGSVGSGRSSGSG
jgi:NADH dehydrogenase